MLKKIFLFSLFLLPAIVYDHCMAQNAGTTTGVLSGNKYENQRSGRLSIYQDPGIDSLINRYILYNMKLKGLEGFRIQIYNSSDKNAREESGKKEAEFINRFPEIKSYITFERPGYYKIRVGDYRTRMEGTKDLIMIRRVFPDAYLVPDRINFPDLN